MRLTLLATITLLATSTIGCNFDRDVASAELRIYPHEHDSEDEIDQLKADILEFANARDTYASAARSGTHIPMAIRTASKQKPISIWLRNHAKVIALPIGLRIELPGSINDEPLQPLCTAIANAVIGEEQSRHRSRMFEELTELESEFSEIQRILVDSNTQPDEATKSKLESLAKDIAQYKL